MTRGLTLTYLLKRAVVVIGAVARRQVGVADLHTRADMKVWMTGPLVDHTPSTTPDEPANTL